MPTAPAAPDLLVITTGCLSRRSSEEARGRPVRSAWPPGGNGLTIVIGRAGNGSSAPAVPASHTLRIMNAVASDRSIVPPGAKRARTGRRAVCVLGPCRYRGGQFESSANFPPARPLGQRQVPDADHEAGRDDRGAECV